MNKEQKKRIRVAGGILLLLYLVLLLYFLFLAEWYGRSGYPAQERHYNLIPFLEIQRFWRYRQQLGNYAVFLNLAGNVLGFVPFGFFLPLVFKSYRKGLKVVWLGLFLTVCVEVMQLYFRVGRFDVDDIILNTGGTILGYMFFRICNFIRR